MVVGENTHTNETPVSRQEYFNPNNWYLPLRGGRGVKRRPSLPVDPVVELTPVALDAGVSRCTMAAPDAVDSVGLDAGLLPLRLRVSTSRPGELESAVAVVTPAAVEDGEAAPDFVLLPGEDEADREVAAAAGGTGRLIMA